MLEFSGVGSAPMTLIAGRFLSSLCFISSVAILISSGSRDSEGSRSRVSITSEPFHEEKSAWSETRSELS